MLLIHHNFLFIVNLILIFKSFIYEDYFAQHSHHITCHLNFICIHTLNHYMIELYFKFIFMKLNYRNFLFL